MCSKGILNPHAWFDDKFDEELAGNSLGRIKDYILSCPVLNSLPHPLFWPGFLASCRGTGIGCLHHSKLASQARVTLWFPIERRIIILNTKIWQQQFQRQKQLTLVTCNPSHSRLPLLDDKAMQHGASLGMRAVNVTKRGWGCTSTWAAAFISVKLKGRIFYRRPLPRLLDFHI